ncbi:hypothetical protein NDU88_009860 [Pleurodeles waltl]|uniref:Uncharacterized protein n=1 Tax=Pleurodeles waltl TaxID=8319 RepID=A0AAV7QVV3_PLEWA|nr:hypothetical protein NDU88_009860 [Pleurodeles waltl]
MPPVSPPHPGAVLVRRRCMPESSSGLSPVAQVPHGLRRRVFLAAPRSSLGARLAHGYWAARPGAGEPEPQLPLPPPVQGGRTKVRRGEGGKGVGGQQGPSLGPSPLDSGPSRHHTLTARPVPQARPRDAVSAGSAAVASPRLPDPRRPRSTSAQHQPVPPKGAGFPRVDPVYADGQWRPRSALQMFFLRAQDGVLS